MNLKGKGSQAKNRYNRELESYKWFVVDLKENKAITGNEYKSDALDVLSDYDDRSRYKVVSEISLKKLGIENPKEMWKYKYDNGGSIDLFEDYNDIPDNVQKVLDKYEDAFMDGDYEGLREAKKEVNKIGYTFNFDMDGTAYGLKPLKKMAKGGGIGDYYIVTFGFNGDEGYQVVKSKPIFAKSSEEAEIMLKDQFESYEGTSCEIFSTEKQFAKGGGVGNENAQICYSIGNDSYGSLELGFYDIPFKNEKRTIILHKSFYKIDDAFSTLFDYLKGQDGKYMMSNDPKSNFYIEEYSYDGKSIDADGNIDLKFKKIFKISAKRLKELISSNNFKKGGYLANENALMVANNNKQISHHTKEMSEALKGTKNVPAWVVAKVNRSASDLSDATHYLEGAEGMYADGGGVEYLTPVELYFRNLDYSKLPESFSNFIKTEILTDPELKYLSEREPIFIEIKEKVEKYENQNSSKVEEAEEESIADLIAGLEVLVPLSTKKEKKELLDLIEGLKLLL